MLSIFLNIVVQYGVAVSAGIISTLVFKAFFSQGKHSQVREYQVDIVKYRSKIMELQTKNEQLEKKLNDREPLFIKDRLFLN